MKNILLIFSISIISLGYCNAQLSYGGGINFILESPNSIGPQAKAIYKINDQWSAGGAFTYFLEDFTFWALDLDAHYLVTTIADDISLSPFVGIDISRVSFSSIIGDFGNTNTNLNLGVSVQKPLSKISLYLEPKLIIGNGSALYISSGVLF